MLVCCGWRAETFSKLFRAQDLMMTKVENGGCGSREIKRTKKEEENVC